MNIFFYVICFFFLGMETDSLVSFKMIHKHGTSMQFHRVLLKDCLCFLDDSGYAKVSFCCYEANFVADYLASHGGAEPSCILYQIFLLSFSWLFCIKTMLADNTNHVNQER